jgi:hypothetical protein
MATRSTTTDFTCKTELDNVAQAQKFLTTLIARLNEMTITPDIYYDFAIRWPEAGKLEVYTTDEVEQTLLEEIARHVMGAHVVTL